MDRHFSAGAAGLLSAPVQSGLAAYRRNTRKDPGHREKIWDVAAGALAITEAGGRVTDLNGQELDFSAGLTLARNPGLVCTNGLLHETLLDGIRAVFE